ncbi:MAG TPA: S9 family peptidase [Acidimicrobiia bacterium]|nr:S9 family peptidase [Acidimicrobiia bacterium]
MSQLSPPVAARRPHVLTEHGDERVDDWYWLRDRDDPEVLAHLKAENAYTDALLAPTKALQDRIYAEIKARIEETDTSAPVPDGPWEYYARTVEGQQYPIHCRRPRGGRAETVLLDENVESEGRDYFSLGGFAVSPDHAVLAYAVDFDGGERYTLRFRDPQGLAPYADVVENVSYGQAWADDNRTLFYVRPDDAMRPWQVWQHTVGTGAGDDVLVFQEDDERFFVGVSRTRSGRFILIDSSSKTTSEVRFIPTEAPLDAPRVIAPREAGHEYAVEHHWNEERGDRFLIVTNANGNARNFKLVAAPAVDPERQYWTDIVPHREDTRLEDVDAFEEHIVLTERRDGLTRLNVMHVESGDMHEVAFPDPVYSAWTGHNAEFESTVLRYGYTSLVAPTTDVDYEMNDRAATTVKVQPVRGYDAPQYTSERAWVTATDGTIVPLSIVRRVDTPLDGSAPALLYGYGAYEYSTEAVFRAARLSLLDRGFVFALAHVRGGGELGRPWYEGGRLEHKRNTFTDFIACGQFLVDNNYTSPSRLVARGGSAGGLLMGAVANLRPDLFAGIVAEVPFVDVLTTMLDPSLPLTITEWEEWGDPREADAYAWMKAYSPYDNVAEHPYPAMFVTSGLNDPRVQYWEPTKWVQKLRACTTSGQPIALRTELGAGHGGPSGRYDAWRDEAMVLAFVCKTVGLAETDVMEPERPPGRH